MEEDEPEAVEAESVQEEPTAESKYANPHNIEVNFIEPD
jgi:hypothetical protein